MEAIALITSALIAGATAALQETAGTAIKDAYHGLTSLIRQKFSKDPTATIALDSYAEDPETWQKPLEKSIRETGVAEDQEIVLAAQKMIELLKSQGPAPKYDVKIDGKVQGFVQGDHAQVTMNFGSETEQAPRKKSSKKF